MGLKEVIGTKVLIADGAMGTMLYQYGVDRSHEELNLSHPEAIKEIHESYIKAGSDIIQTNTYGANYLKLARYGLEQQVKEINEAAVAIAREAAIGTDTFILGTIGGIRGAVDSKVNERDLKEIVRSSKEQLDTLLNAKVDGIILETYYDLEELKAVLTVARDATEIPIIANVSLHETGYLQTGLPLATALQELADLGADVVGINCLLGPHYMAKSLRSVPIIKGVPLSVFPNVSFPAVHEGKIVYESETEYFKSFSELFRQEGAGIIGGCCGTTPAHIAAYREGLIDFSIVTEKKVEPIKAPTFKPRPKQESPRLLDKLRKQYTVIVELAPPRTLNTDLFFKGALELKKVGVDAVTLSDNSLASARISNLALAALLKHKYDVPTLIHMTTRDHNLIGLNSQIMGLHTLGIHDVLAVTGDPAKVGDLPGASSVFDINSFELIKLVKKFNEGMSYTGKNMGEQTDFHVASALNLNIPRLERAGRLLQKKQAAGADYFITQPIFDPSKVKVLKQLMKDSGIKIPVFIGVIPLVSSRNAEFLHNEVPGILLTDETRQRMKLAEEKGKERQEGIEISKELIDVICEEFKGIYLMTPFMRYEITAELTEYVKEKNLKRIVEKR